MTRNPKNGVISPQKTAPYNVFRNPPEFELGVIYARYSSSGQRDESIEGQLRECREYADRYGIRIVGEYCDRAMTGTNDKRPEFQRMIRDSAKGQFSVVIVWKIDRFARSKYDSSIYKHKLKQNGVKVLYAKESVPEGPEGIIFESIMEGYAEYYSANLSQNVRRGLYENALANKSIGHFPLGYERGPEGTLVINESESPIVVRIFNEYSSGVPTKEIVANLNKEGFRTRLGNPFNLNSIRRILQCERYIGVYEYDDIRNENGVPPIIDKELFDRVQKMVAVRTEKPAAKKIDGGFLLTSKLFCGMCGEPMTGDSGTGKSGRVYQYYTCVNIRRKKCKKERAPKEWIEDAVVSALADIANDDQMIEKITDRYMQWQSERQLSSAISEFDNKLRRNESAIKNTMSLIDSGFISDAVKSHLVELESERASLERGRAKALLNEPDLKREQVAFFLSRFKNFDLSDIKWRIYLVETFLKAAYLFDDGRLLLHLNYTGNESKTTVQIAENATENGDLLCSDLTPPTAPQKSQVVRLGFFERCVLFENVMSTSCVMIAFGK